MLLDGTQQPANAILEAYMLACMEAWAQGHHPRTVDGYARMKSERWEDIVTCVLLCLVISMALGFNILLWAAIWNLLWKALT